MSDRFRKPHPSENHERLQALWHRAKNNDFDGLDDQQRRIAQAMGLHADEFETIFSTDDDPTANEREPDTETDPFFHISIHAAVEAQLEAREPVEAFAFYHAMRKKKCTHHEAVHLIGAVLAPLMFQTMKSLTPFDSGRYAALLKKYKSRHPEKIWDLLEAEFAAENDAFNAIFDDYQGPCQACGAAGSVDENGFCESCADKYERDMLRLRQFQHSLTAAYLPEDQHEDLRRDVIEQFGMDLEIVSHGHVPGFDPDADRSTH